jgi:hypothetical protein
MWPTTPASSASIVNRRSSEAITFSQTAVTTILKTRIINTPEHLHSEIHPRSREFFTLMR